MEQSSEIYNPHLKDIDISAHLARNYDSEEMKALRHRISVAPMIDITNFHFRFFMRLLTKHATLYTEMIHENAIMHNVEGTPKDLLRFHPIEHPVVLQVGGNNPKNLTECTKKCEALGFDEVNINIGCPSSRVQSGAFGACLMREPDLVSECVSEMQKAVKIPVTIKTRLGVDDLDTYEFVHEFVKKTSEKGGTKHFIMHARKALLKGLSPAENRNIPPLQYEKVVRLKQDFPHLEFSINGGFKTIETIKNILNEDKGLKGCMIGRLCYENPWILADVDRVFYNQKNLGYSRREILEIYAEYAQKMFDDGIEKSPSVLVKPVMPLFTGEKGCAKYRQFLGNHQTYKDYPSIRSAIYEAIRQFEQVNAEALDAKPPTGDLEEDTKKEKEVSEKDVPEKKEEVAEKKE